MKKIFTATLALSALSLAISIFELTSCKKAEAQNTASCPPATYPITGIWEGTYTTTQVSHPPTYVAFVIFPDGTFMRRGKIVGNNSDYAITKGTWQLSGNAFQFKDTTSSLGSPIIASGTATFMNSGILENATWRDVSGRALSGSLQNMRRIN